jgi:Rrf2 family protein
MLGIRRETDYAVRTVLHLATMGEGVQLQVRDVADQRALPLSFVRRIVARLSASGILETTRGMGGGIKLARPAAEISMLDVVRAMEGNVTLNPCVLDPHTCPLAEVCPAQRAWVGATAMLEAHLASIHFEALAGGTRRHVAAHRDIQPLPGLPKSKGPLAKKAASPGAKGTSKPKTVPAARRKTARSAGRS